MSLESKAKSAVWIHNELYYKDMNPDSLWVPVEDALSVKRELISYQQTLEKKTEEWSKREFDLCSKIQDQQKQLELNDHNAKVLLKVADNEIARLKEIVYCTCKTPNYNKFGMDNCCDRCGKVIENHPLTPKHQYSPVTTNK